MPSIEDFLQKSASGDPTFGYFMPTADPLHYLQTIKTELTRVQQAGLINKFCITDSYDEMDIVRDSPGVTFCVMLPDQLPENELLYLGICCADSERFYFTKERQRDQSYWHPKSQNLISGQKGQVYANFPYLHQDFVLAFYHDQRIKNILDKGMKDITTEIILP